MKIIRKAPILADQTPPMLARIELFPPYQAPPLNRLDRLFIRVRSFFSVGQKAVKCSEFPLLVTVLCYHTCRVAAVALVAPKL